MLYWFASLWQDLAYSCRVLKNNPVYTATAIATLGLGLGLNLAFFAMVNAAISPPPVRDPYTLASATFFASNGNRAITLQDMVAFRKESRAIVEAAATRFTSTGLDGENAGVLAVSGDYFPMLGGTAMLGRVLREGDNDNIAVLSERTWRTRYSADPRVVGRKILVGGVPFEVAGVAQTGFRGVGQAPSVWVPLTKPSDTISPLFRIKPGITFKQAEDELTRYWKNVTSSKLADQQITRVTTNPVGRSYTDALAQGWKMLLIAFGLTMAIPCANAANLLLARALGRQREMGVRLAIGASRGRMIQQLMLEAVLLSVGGGLLGALLARLGLNFGIQVFQDTLPSVARADVLRSMPEFQLDYHVFGYMFGVALLAAIAFALLPAMQSTKHSLSMALRGEFGFMKASRLRGAFVVAQVAVCVVLLVLASVMLRKTNKVASTQTGLDAAGVFSVTAPLPKHRAALLTSLETEPWMEPLATAALPPFASPSLTVRADNGTQDFKVSWNMVSPGYLPMFRIPIITGRNFTESVAPLAIVSESAAKAMWPGQDPIGKLVRNPSGKLMGRDMPSATVIGVAADVVAVTVMENPEKKTIYFPRSLKDTAGVGNLYVRGKGTPDDTRRRLDAFLVSSGAVDQGARISPVAEQLDMQQYGIKLLAVVASLLGTVALILTLAGMYGAASYLLGQRTKEIGIRMAIGATAGDASRFLFAYSMRLTAIGMVVGVVLAMVIGSLISGLVEVINVYDWPAYVIGLSVVALAAVASTAGPALGAARVDPVSCLRSE